MLAALAGGVVHLAVFPDHALLRLEYSIFLLSAAVAQVLFGVLYTIIPLTDNASSGDRSDNISARIYYRKSLIVNLIGLAGIDLAVTGQMRHKGISSVKSVDTKSLS